MNSINRLQELGVIGSAFRTSSLHDEVMKAAQLATATAGVAAIFRENDAMRTAQLTAARLAVFQENHAHIAAMKSAFDVSAIQGLFSHSEAMKLAQHEMFGMNAAMKAALNVSAFGSVADVLKSMKQLPDPSLLSSISTTSDALRKMTGIFSGSQHLHDLAKTANLVGQSYQAMMRSYGMDTLADKLSSFDWPASITVNDDDSITVDESTIGSDVLKEAITQATVHVTRQDVQELENQVVELVEQIRKQPNSNPVIQQVLIPLIIGIFFAFFNSAVDFITKAYLDDDQPSPTTIAANQTQPFSSFRLVTRKVLTVRISTSTKARTVGQLYADQIITLIEERDGWARVSWSSKSDSVSLQGWVLAKYLRELQ